MGVEKLYIKNWNFSVGLSHFNDRTISAQGIFLQDFADFADYHTVGSMINEILQCSNMVRNKATKKNTQGYQNLDFQIEFPEWVNFTLFCSQWSNFDELLFVFFALKRANSLSKPRLCKINTLCSILNLVSHTPLRLGLPSTF